MAGSLIKVAETTVSSAVASVTLSGIDSTYDVYKIIVNKRYLYYIIDSSDDTGVNFDRSIVPWKPMNE